MQFSYRAQTAAGAAVTGTLEAPTQAAAQATLQSWSLRVLDMTAVAEATKGSRPLRGQDFLAFNQQLAYLATAGLPIEQGLRLIAQDTRSGRLAASINAVAGDLEAGLSLPAAFERQQQNFPPLYSRLIDAGIQTSNLPGVLLNLGRHMELIQRARAAVWRAASYPLMVIVAMTAVLMFLGLYVLPSFEAIFSDFRTTLPPLTEFVIWMSHWMPAAVVSLLIVLIAFPMLAMLPGLHTLLVEGVGFRLPIVGPALRHNLLARWLDALRLGVDAGLDLPRAMSLASEAIASPALTRQAGVLINELNAGHSLNAASLHYQSGPVIIPATVPASIQLASDKGSLSETLATLGDMYQQQADSRLTLLPLVVTPLLMFVAMIGIGTMIGAVFLPFVKLIQSVSGGEGG